MKGPNYDFPLTQVKGKIRIKERFAFSDYGQSIAPRQTTITSNHYIEWQIGYDKENNENAHFIGINGKEKQIYELSEFLEFGLKMNLISKKELENLRLKIENNDIFIDEKEKITREHFISEKIGEIEFLKSRVSYPLLVHKFESKDMLCEIIVREKQLAVGTMPMLYFCIPMAKVQDKKSEFSFVGRQIQSKENGYLQINSSNIAVFVKMFQIFGLLSKTHKHDCLEILNYILGGRQ